MAVNEEGKNAVKKIYELFIKGYGFKKIAEVLNGEGLKTNKRKNIQFK